VRLDSRLEVWVSSSDLHPVPAGFLPAHRVAGNARLEPHPEWVDLVVPMAARPAYFVDEGSHELTLTLYDTMINTDIVNYGANDSLVRETKWTQDASDRGHFTLQLSAAPYGYLAYWQNGAFVLRVRRPPHIDGGSPLKGLTIAIDPGHPPIGATGPTGLYEPVPTLAVGLVVQRMLEERGAKVVMTRTTADPVALGDRPVIARKGNANALVSIHLNALPDGINPFTSNGTGAYYFRSHSIPLARELQRAMVARMGLRNLGINYDNLRLARPTWMPAVLCEGAFLMIPEQENALRTPEFQRAYATAIVDGLESYFRTLPAR
jgi:N-acetylmuramoyl-L-alanine amidase